MSAATVLLVPAKRIRYVHFTPLRARLQCGTAGAHTASIQDIAGRIVLVALCGLSPFDRVRGLRISSYRVPSI